MFLRHRRLLYPILCSLVVSSLLCFSFPIPAPAANINYVYDELGRLIAVVDPANDTAMYQYDAVGNLLSITRRSSSLVSIIDFWPRSGPVGTVVTISGTSFGSLPTQNTVTFNGITATVTAASATQLTVVVPAAATTGPIRVTAPTGFALSATPFTKTAGGSTSAPTITSFTPTMGAVGTPVTITGTNFDLTPVNDRVSFKATLATVSSATSTTISTSVPSAAQSGPLSVATAYGTAATTSDFFLLPPGVTAGNVGFSGRITMGGSSLTATLSLPGKVGLVIFDAVAGQRVNLGLTNVTMTSSMVSILKPDGSVLSSISVGTGGGSLDSPVLPVTGTYTILIAPSGSYTGNITLTLSSEIAGTMTIGGPAVAASITRTGQNARYTFSGTAGQRLNLGMTGVTITSTTVSLLKPDSTVLSSVGLNTSGGSIDPPALPVSGTYTILIDPTGTYTGSVTLTLSSELAGTITIGGAAVTATITRPGQNARYTFNGTAGQRLNLGLTGVTITSTTVSLLTPGSTLLTSINLTTTGGALDPPALPVTGTYTILINPAGTSTGSLILTLSGEITGTITIGGTAVTATIPRVGQNARYTFSSTAGQQVSLGLTGVTFASATVSLLTPGGTLLTSINLTTAGGFLNSPVLPVTGTYTILVNPSGTSTGSVTLTLTNPNLTNTIVVNGPPVTMTTAVPGQDARYTFSATAGQRMSLGLTGVTIVSSTISLLKPDGTTLTSIGLGTGGEALDFPVLPVTGTYTILIDPSGSYTGSVTLTLSGEITGTITIGGGAVTATIIRPGQNARYTFSGTAGQLVSLNFTTVTTTPASGWLYFDVFKPDGSSLASTYAYSGYSDITETQALPATGTYTILVNPPGVATGTATLTLISDVLGSVTFAGPPVTVTIAVPGQNARYTFTGTAGQRVSLGLTGVTFGFSTVSLLKPDGTPLIAMDLWTDGGALDLPPLPVTGLYTIFIDPFYTYTGSLILTLSNEVTGTLTIGGAAVTATITRIGQNARYTFSGTAGQLVNLNLAAIATTPAGGWLNFYVYKPDGSSLVSTYAWSGYSADIGPQTLLTTGTYMILVDPPGTATGSATVRVTIP